MKIEKIILQNLTPVVGEQTIDFTVEPLRSAGLYAIMGDGDLGKRVVVDALCLALYGRAPRLEHAPLCAASNTALAEQDELEVAENPAAAILCSGQKQCSAAVVFLTASGERYEAVWSMSTARDGSCKMPERSFKQLAPSKQRLGKDSEIQPYITQTVGLNYKQFLRTIVLPQQRFAAFLQAKESDKATLLEELTGTEVYGVISAKIYQLTQAAKCCMRDLESQRQGMLHDQLDPEALREERERMQLLTAGKNAETEAAAKLMRQLEWLMQYEEAKRCVSEGEELLQNATKACMETRADELTLERYDALVGMQPLYQEITLRRMDVEQIKGEENANLSRIELLCKNLERLAAQLDMAKERTADAERRQASRLPVISRGYALTGEINVAAGQLKRQEEQLLLAQRTLESRQNILRSKQEMLAKVASEIDSRQLRKQSLSVHRVMFEKFDLIKDKLSLFHTETHRNVESHKKQQTLQKRKVELKQQGERAEMEQHDHQAKLNALKSELLIHRQANQGRDSAKLQKAAAENRSRLTALQRAAMLWQHISEGYARISEKRATQKREATELAQLQQQLSRLEADILVADEAYNRIATAYTLSQSENITKLRKQLKEGTACPVCGATHHPYHTETERELGELLTNLDKEYREMQESLLAKRSQLAALREKIAADAARIEAGEQALTDLEARQQADIKEWGLFAYLDNSFADCTPTANREARAMMIQLLIDSTTRAADEADYELDDFNIHQQHINRLNEEIAALDIKMADNHTYLDKIRTEMRVAVVSSDELQQTINLSDKACSELYTDLDEMITLSGWFTDWKNNADSLRMRLSDLHNDWNMTCMALEENQRAVDLLHEEIKGAQANVDEAQRVVVVSREGRDASREDLERKYEEMRHLFGAETPQQEAEKLQNAVNEARMAEQTLYREYEAERGQIKQLEGIRKNLLNCRQNNQQLLQEKQQQLDLLILRFNGAHSPVQFSELDMLFSDVRDWKALRRKLDEQKEQRIVASNRLEQSRKALLRLQASTSRPEDGDQVSVDELRAKLDEHQQRVAKIDEQLNLSVARIHSHENCERRVELLSTQLDAAVADYKEWERLNMLLGSADGQRFRNLAQAYILQSLVACANRHLQQIAPRYGLCVQQGSLSIEVVDGDCFDLHRSITTLSSGENFVVSLALALALASLLDNDAASESLFIADIPVNWDDTSYSLVMQALCNLEQTPGRKVGVICSATQTGAQLSPQICVCRESGCNHCVVRIG